jgi:hypothetical protein
LPASPRGRRRSIVALSDQQVVCSAMLVYDRHDGADLGAD